MPTTSTTLGGWALACASLSEETIPAIRVSTPRLWSHAIIGVVSLWLSLWFWAQIILKWIPISIEHFFGGSLRRSLLTHHHSWERLYSTLRPAPWSLSFISLCPGTSCALFIIIVFIPGGTSYRVRSVFSRFLSWDLLVQHSWISLDCFSHFLSKWIPIWRWSLLPTTAGWSWSYCMDLSYLSLSSSLWALRPLPWSFNSGLSWGPGGFFFIWRFFQFFKTNSLELSAASTAGWTVWPATFNTVSSCWVELIWSLRSDLKRRNIFFDNRWSIFFLLIWGLWLSWRWNWWRWLTIHKTC